jgi:hypothetical protein
MDPTQLHPEFVDLAPEVKVLRLELADAHVGGGHGRDLLGREVERGLEFCDGFFELFGERLA